MTDDKPIDLPAVQRERRKLDKLAKEHPHLVGAPDPGEAERWEQTLRDDEEGERGRRDGKAKE